MTTTLQVPAVLLSVFAIMIGTGCGTTNGPVAASPHFAPGVSPGLVMTTHSDDATWEYGRYDEQLNVGQPPVVGSGWAEIRTWDRQRTSNGRPREQSTSYTRTITRRPSY